MASKTNDSQHNESHFEIIIDALRDYRVGHHISQTEISEKLDKKVKVGQSALSKMERGKQKMSFDLAWAYCDAMGSDLPTVLYEYWKKRPNIPNQEIGISKEYLEQGLTDNSPLRLINIQDNQNLICNISDPAFNGWKGNQYYCYFYSTLSNEQDKLFQGIMDIPAESTDGLCHVSFEFEYDSTTHKSKKYDGQLLISKTNSSVYCILINYTDQGEITFLTMSNPDVKNTKVHCVVAFALTISGGKGTRRPCVERMIISCNELTGNALDRAKVHLTLNDKYIRITEDDLRNLLHSDLLPVKFVNTYLSDPNDMHNPIAASFFREYKRVFVEVPEDRIKSLPAYSDSEKQQLIDLLRQYSSEPVYKKINSKATDDDIYQFMFSTCEESYN